MSASKSLCPWSPKADTITTIDCSRRLSVNPNRLKNDMAAWSVVFFVLVASLYAQEKIAPQHTGVPQDWSRSHIIFSRDALAQHPEMMNQEPRILHQAMQRWQAPDWGTFHC